MFGFGFSKGSTNNSNRSEDQKDGKKKDDFMNMDFDVGAGMGEFRDEDLFNDAELMKEYDMLMGHDSSATGRARKDSKSKNKPAKNIVKINVPLADEEVDVEKVEIDEKDLEDPSLLAELHALPGEGGKEDAEVDFTPRQEVTETVKEEQVVTETKGENYQVDVIAEKISAVSISEKENETPELTEDHLEQEIAPKEEGIPLEEKLKTSDTSVLEKYINLEKMKALQAKKENNISEARKALIASKQLKQRLDQVTAERTTKPSNAQYNIAVARIQEYKNAALNAKKSNDIVKAKDFLMAMKKVEGLVANYNSGISVDWSILPPEPNNFYSKQETNTSSLTPNASAKQLPSRPSSAKSSTENLPTDLLDIVKLFSNQIQEASNIAQKFSLQGELEKSKLMQRIISLLQSDLASIKTEQTVPKLKSVNLEFVLQDLNHDVSLNEACVVLVRGLGLSCKDVSLGADLNCYVKWDFGWPPVDKPQHNLSKGETNKEKGINPMWHSNKFVPIERTKAFLRHVERKKLVIDVYHHKGLIWGSTFVGHAEVRLNDLIEKSEIHTIVDLMDQNNRKPVGGKVEVKVLLREPLVKKQRVVKREKWILLDSFDTSLLVSFLNHSASHLLSLPTSSSNTQSRKASKSNESAKPSASIISPVSTATTLKTSPKPLSPSALTKLPVKSVDVDDKIQELIDKFERVDLLVSNNVLEAELSTLQQKIAHDKVKLSVSEEDQDKVQQIQLKLQLLVIQVQTGQLTMESYLSQVKQSINETKSMAVEFKRSGNIEYAKKALARLKIMQEEVSEAESSQ